MGARRFHLATRHRPISHVGGSMDPAKRPSPFKTYREGELVPFSREWQAVAAPALDVLAGRARPSGQAPRRADLERMCHLSNGVLRWRAGPGLPGGRSGFRAAPCTGALYHIELYVACGSTGDLPAGLYHHDAREHGFRRLRGGDHRAVLVEAAAGDPVIAHAQAVVVVTSEFFRNAWKYGARAYRHAYWDGGVVIANLLAVAQGLGLAASVVVGFADPLVEQLLGIDPEQEGVVALVAIGGGARPAPAAGDLPDLRLDREPAASSLDVYQAITDAHRQTSLPAPQAVARWRESVPRTAAGEAHLAVSPQPGASIEKVIRARRSTRRFAVAPISQAQLEALNACALAPIPSDAITAAGRTGALRIALPAIDGLEPGIYEAGATGLTPVRFVTAGRLRRSVRDVALWQSLGHEAAATFFWTAGLDAVLEALGDRGYRALALGGPIAAGRLELAAHALGLGATGLTFHDDMACRLVGVPPARTAITYLAAVGVPWRRAP